MTTSVRQPTLVDRSIGHLVVRAVQVLIQEPPDDALIETCECQFPCREHGHPGIWIRTVVVVNGRPIGLTYWTYSCLFGCEPLPPQHEA